MAQHGCDLAKRRRATQGRATGGCPTPGRPVHINTPGTRSVNAGIALPSNTEIIIAKAGTLTGAGGASFFHTAKISRAGVSGHVSGSRIHGGGAIANLRHVGQTMGVDATKSIIKAPAAGDMLRNTNAALACSAGLMVSDGGKWKNLFSGATY